MPLFLDKKAFWQDKDGVALVLFIVFLALPVTLLAGMWTLFESQVQRLGSQDALQQAIIAFHAPSALPERMRPQIDEDILVKPLWIEERLFLGACFPRQNPDCDEGFSSLGEILPKRSLYHGPFLVIVDTREHLGTQQITFQDDIKPAIEHLYSVLRAWFPEVSLDILLKDNTLLPLPHTVARRLERQLQRPLGETLSMLLSQSLEARTVREGELYHHIMIFRYAPEELPASPCEDETTHQRKVTIDIIPLSYGHLLENATRGQCSFVGVLDNFDHEAILTDMLLRRATKVRILYAAP